MASMRIVFDQYSTQENQLTHALVTALACEVGLAAAFLRWSVLIERPTGSRPWSVPCAIARLYRKVLSRSQHSLDPEVARASRVFL